MIHLEAFKALSVHFLDEENCRAWILDKLHPDGACCPGCHRAIDEHRRLDHFFKGERLRCQGCGKYFSALTGTILNGAHLDMRGLFLLAVLSGAGISDKIIASKLNITRESVRLWRLKFETTPLFSG